MKYGNNIVFGINGKYEETTVKCNCECHEPGKIIMHFSPCCNNGYVRVYKKIEIPNPQPKN